jgi:hypothetical protein
MVLNTTWLSVPTHPCLQKLTPQHTRYSTQAPHLHVLDRHHIVRLDHVRPHSVDQELHIVDAVCLQQAGHAVCTDV